jgi:HEPN domain-containing protein
MDRNDLQNLSQLRLAEAQALLNAGHYAGSYYLAGYAAECAIKACIAKGVQQYDFPDKDKVNQSYTHDLVKLIKVAGLEGTLTAAIAANAALAQNWATAKDWSEGKRYALGIVEQDARDLVAALTANPHGILAWLTAHW